MSSWNQWMADELADLDAQARRRSLRTALPLPAGWLELDGERVLNLSGNDYLGLAAELSVEMIAGQGGATASRLVVGNHPCYLELEATLADLKGTEAALVFGSGFLANSSLVPALAGRDDAIFCDRLNHASIVDGCLLSRARLQRYRHGDMEHLESLLQASKARRKLIVTDAVFSMDGDLAPLAALVELKNRYGAMLMVDEAHSGGVFGERGEGLVHASGLSDQVEIQMGTLSKAYGCYGAYVAGDCILVDYLINRARGLIFSTGLPPVVIRLAQTAIERASRETWRRDRLWSNARRFRQALSELGFDIGASESQIVPVIVGDDELTMSFSARLLAAGVGGIAIRPPTVPAGSARIRFSVSAAHRWPDLKAALHAIESIGRDLGLLPAATEPVS